MEVSVKRLFLGPEAQVNAMIEKSDLKTSWRGARAGVRASRYTAAKSKHVGGDRPGSVVQKAFAG